MASIIFKNPLKASFSIRNIVLQFLLGVFGLEKETFNGLLMLGYWYTINFDIFENVLVIIYKLVHMINKIVEISRQVFNSRLI